jgi:hypothetical protein
LRRETEPVQVLEEEVAELLEKLRIAKEEIASLKGERDELKATASLLREQKSILSWDYFMSQPDSFPFKSFTGFTSPKVLSAFYDFMNCNNVCDRVLLYRDPKHSLNVSSAEQARRGEEHRGTDRALSPQDGVVLTLVILRTGMTYVESAALFGVSEQTVSRHFITWLVFLEKFLTAEFPYPTVEQLEHVTPSRVKQALSIMMKGVHFEAFVDCHEQECETPTSKLTHKKVWSEYKKRTTLKFFGAIAGNGVFTFASTAYRGRLTDPVVTRLCGYLEVIHEHGATGADKGFDMIPDFSARHALLVIPPKANSGQTVFTQDEMIDTADIARERIHVERAFKRAQEYKILHRKIPVGMFDLWG